MIPFHRPRPNETTQQTDARKEAMIRFLILKHQWLRKDAIETLEGLDEVGLAYIGVEMRERERLLNRVGDYDPFAKAWELDR